MQCKQTRGVDDESLGTPERAEIPGGLGEVDPGKESRRHCRKHDPGLTDSGPLSPHYPSSALSSTACRFWGLECNQQELPLPIGLEMAHFGTHIDYFCPAQWLNENL
jgi:hypothetical protein